MTSSVLVTEGRGGGVKNSLVFSVEGVLYFNH